MLSPNKQVLDVPEYHPPLAGRAGLRLDFNENTIGCSPRVLERLRRLSAEEFSKYPEREPVEARVAEFLSVRPAELLLTNGVDEAIHLLCQTYLGTGDEALIVVPTYSMYRIYAAGTGADVVSIPAGKNFEFPAKALRERISSRTRFIAIANPNNPTGSVVEAQQLLDIARAAPGAAVLIDEAYFEFCGRTILRERRELSNLFVARTFSKAYGLAGLRVGVLAGDEEQMRSVRRMCSPYNVNAVALACLPEAIEDQAYIREYVREVLESRTQIASFLQSNQIQYWPSQANFLLLQAGNTKAEAARFVEEMRRRNILVRDRSNDYHCEGCVRITLGPRAHTKRLLTAIEETFEKLGFAQGVSQG